KEQIKNHEKLATELVSGNCCNQEMLLEKTEENNRVNLKYTCPKCNRTVPWNEIKPKETITLTIKQREKLFYYLGSIEEILYKAEDDENR
ncbi:6450_t:CDS:1, partial [Ambispora leptoticha]